MNFETYTERARGFVQSAQTGALAAGHQQFTPEHLLKVLLDDPEGLCAGLIERAGGRARDALAATEQALAKLPKVSGGQGQLYLAAPTATRVRHGREDRQEGRRQLRHGRAAAAGAGHGEGGRHGEDPRRCGRHAAEPQRRHRGDPQGAHGRHGLGREPVRRAEEIHPRPDGRRPRGQARPGHRPRRGDPPHHPGAVAAHQEQSRADRRARRRQDRDRRRAGAPHRQRRRAGEPQGQEAAGARHGRADRRRQISRRVRGAPQGRAQRDPGLRRRRHPVHRRDAHAGRRRQGGRRHGRLQPVEAGAGARRPALHRRHHARRVPQVCREGRGARPALPAGVRRRADGRGHHLDPARPQGEVRAAPRRAHHRLGAGLRGDAVQPLHHRPLPARQGDRPDGRGGVAPAHAGRFQAGGAGRTRPAHHPAQDRARGAEEGDRPGLQGPARPAGEGTGRPRRAVERADPALDRREGQAGLGQQGQGAARPGAHRPRPRPARRRSGQGRRACLWPHPGARAAAEGGRGASARRRRHGGRGGDARPHRSGRVALDRHSGRQDAGGRARQAAAHGRRTRQAGRRPGGGGACGVDRGPACARRPAGPEPADRLVHVPGPHRRRQDRAHQGAGGVPVRRRDRRWCASTCRNTWRSTRSPG